MAFSLGKLVIVEDTLRTIKWSAQYVRCLWKIYGVYLGVHLQYYFASSLRAFTHTLRRQALPYTH